MKDQSEQFGIRIKGVETEVKQTQTSVKVLEEKCNELQGLSQKQLD